MQLVGAGIVSSLIEVSTPRRSNLIRPVPGVSLILVSGLCFRANRGRSTFNGLRLGFESGSVVVRATPGGRIRKTPGHSWTVWGWILLVIRSIFPKEPSAVHPS